MSTLSLRSTPGLGPFTPPGVPAGSTVHSTLRIEGRTRRDASNEFLAVIGLVSDNTGTDIGGKVGLYVANEVQPGSGNAWSLNTVMLLDAIETYPPVWTVAQGYELDVQNNSGHDLDGTEQGRYGFGLNVAGGGPNALSSALMVTGQSANWSYGLLIEPNAVSGVAFADLSDSVISLQVAGTHAVGIDLSTGSYFAAAAILLGNSGEAQGVQGIAGRTSAGTPVNLLEINAGDFVVLGSPGVAGLACAGGVFPALDNTYPLGASFARWSSVWTAEPTIESADPAARTDVADLPPMLNLVLAVDPKSFRWTSTATLAETTVEEPVHATTEVTQDETAIEMRNGVAVQLRRKRTRQVPAFDKVPVFDESGAPVMHETPARPATYDSEGNLLRVAAPARSSQVMHRVPRMTTKPATRRQRVEQPGQQTHFGFVAADLKAAFDRIGIDFGGCVGEGGGLRPSEQIPILWKAVQELAAMVGELKARVGK